MGITLKEIARLAGVSRPAVSLVVKDAETRHVSPEKRVEILRLLKEHGYRPDYAARKLRGMPTRTVGMIGSLFTVPVHSAIMNGIMKRLWEAGYQVLLSDHGGTREGESRIVEEFRARGVDALVLLNAASAALRKDGDFPCVAVTHNQDCYDLAVDLRLGGLIAGRHLLGHGRRKLGFVTGSRDSGILRLEGLRAAMEEAGIAETPPVLYHLDEPEKFGERVVGLVKERHLDGVFCMNDYYGAATIRCLSAAGIGVPDDVAVIGFDGLAFGALTLPSLTTVVQPVDALAERCVKMLLERLETGMPTGVVAPELLPPALHIGGSCGCADSGGEITFIPQPQLAMLNINSL